MRFLMIHNDYGAPSGEEIQFYLIRDLLVQHGHEVKLFTRSSAEIPAMTMGHMRAFCSGIFNPWSRKRVAKLLEEFKPDVVLIKNLFPFISPAILPVIRRAGVPIVMFVANYRLMCPNGLHMSKGKTCEKCLGGREYNCVINNCEGNLFKSTGYALRNTVARVTGLYQRNISAFVCASRFLKKRLGEAGFDTGRMHLIPNVVPEFPEEVEPTVGSYVGYVGRISREKGVHVLFEAARKSPEIRFRLAGRVAEDFQLPNPLPANVELVGFLKEEELAAFYNNARFIVSTSECFETFGMSVGEAMQHGKTVIVSRIGVFPEFVADGERGLLFEPGNATELAEKIHTLWADPDRCMAMGCAGREWAHHEYSPNAYYARLIKVCEALAPHAAAAAAMTTPVGV